MRTLTNVLAAAAACAACLVSLAPSAQADVTYYTPPAFKNKVQPVYPDSARAAHETGTVLVQVLVLANGQPKTFRIIKSSGHKDLDDAVLAALKRSTFTPAMRGSTPQTAFYDATYRFTLTGLAQDEGSSGDLSKKLASNPHDASTRIALGTNYLEAKNFSQAESVFQTGTQLDPNNAKLWAYEGLAYLQDAQANKNTDKYKQSADAFDQAMKIDPHNELALSAGGAYFNYGYQLQQNGDNAGAATYAQKAIAIAPKEAQYYILLGEAQTGQGNFADAVTTLKKAESLDDKKNPIITSRIVADEGNAELSQNDRANGMADINRAEQIDSHALFAYEYLWSYYLKNGNRSAALTPLTQLAQLDPKNPYWQVQIGTIYLDANNVASARQAFQKALALDPSSGDAQFGMIELSAASGDTSTLDAQMQKLTANAAPKTAAMYETSIASNLLNSGKANVLPDAQKYADQATKADPNNGQAWYALAIADIQINKNDHASANAALKKAYDIFKSQNNAQMIKQVSDTYKQINGTDLGS